MKKISLLLLVSLLGIGIGLLAGCTPPWAKAQDEKVMLGWTVVKEVGARAVNVYTCTDAEKGVPVGWIVVDTIPADVLGNPAAYGMIYLCVSTTKVPCAQTPGGKTEPILRSLNGYYVVSPTVYSLIKLNAIKIAADIPPLPALPAPPEAATPTALTTK